MVHRETTLLSGTPFYPWISHSKDKKFVRGLTANQGIFCYNQLSRTGSRCVLKKGSIFLGPQMIHLI